MVRKLTTTLTGPQPGHRSLPHQSCRTCLLPANQLTASRTNIICPPFSLWSALVTYLSTDRVHIAVAEDTSRPPFSAEAYLRSQSWTRVDHLHLVSHREL